MSNKKGEVAAEELRGILTFMVVTVIIMLFFFGCSISKAKTEYEQLKFSKEEIKVIKELNRFLFSETPADPDKKIYGLILGYLEDLDKNHDWNNDFVGFTNKMISVTQGRLPANRGLAILLPDGKILYDSDNYYSRKTSYVRIYESVAILPVPRGPSGFVFVKVVLYII